MIQRIDYLVKTDKPIEGAPCGEGYALLRLEYGAEKPRLLATEIGTYRLDFGNDPKSKPLPEAVAVANVVAGKSSWPAFIKAMGADAFAKAFPNGPFGDYA